DSALALEEAGAFALLLEGMKSEAATRITQAVKIPTIGIGAGNGTDGQVLVWSDMFGFFEAFKPKFVKRYLNGAELIRQGLREYREEVKSWAFPDEEHSY
ncbi:3-methyl-2-oxobutanoate hydroxymethyltransferase, partial [Nitratifractor sp.]|uniref:3-methyl-2-oxobutanoate hydroxymethyltransferase n=1 Tax=Nitratifractor sp. TaxID=2268144 RepID=UPI0025FF62D9